MSLLHLLGVDDDITFDGKNLDKTIDNIKGLANNEFSEDEIDSANGTLEDILSCAESIDSLENISDNIVDLEYRTKQLIDSNLSVFKILNRIARIASEYCDENDGQHTQDLLHTVAEQAEDALIEMGTMLEYELDFSTTFDSSNSRFKHYLLPFIPKDVVLLSNSDRSGLVRYVSGDWEFELSTYIGYGGLRMTPKTIKYKHVDFCQCYEKIVEIGLDPQKLTIEDVQLLKIVDSQNELVYNLFIESK